MYSVTVTGRQTWTKQMQSLPSWSLCLLGEVAINRDPNKSGTADAVIGIPTRGWSLCDAFRGGTYRMSRSQPGTKQVGSAGRVSSAEGAAVWEGMGWGPHLLECWELRGDQCAWRRSARWQQTKPGSQARHGKGSFRQERKPPVGFRQESGGSGLCV